MIKISRPEKLTGLTGKIKEEFDKNQAKAEVIYDKMERAAKEINELFFKKPHTAASLLTCSSRFDEISKNYRELIKLPSHWASHDTLRDWVVFQGYESDYFGGILNRVIAKLIDKYESIGFNIKGSRKEKLEQLAKLE